MKYNLLCFQISGKLTIFFAEDLYMKIIDINRDRKMNFYAETSRIL